MLEAGQCVLVEVCEYECVCTSVWVYMCQSVCWVGCLGGGLASSSRCRIISSSECHTPSFQLLGS